MIKAVIFDMDGVLIDSEPANLEQIRSFFKLHGKCAEEAYLYSLVGRSAHDTWDITANAWKTPITYDEYHQAFQAYCEQETMDYPSLLFPHTKELLQWLKEEGYLVAVASSSKLRKIKEVLQACEITSYFDVMLSGEMFQRSKPDPEIYIKSAEALGVLVSECIAIEDSKAGIASCLAANMKVIARVDERFGADATLADEQIHNFLEVKQLLIDKYR